MHISILSESAGPRGRAKRPASPGRKPAKRPTAKKKQHKIPVSIEKAVAVTKPKPRVLHAEPGRYVLKSKVGQFAIVRIKEEVKYVPSMKRKLFALREMESLSSEGYDFIGTGAYSEPVEELEAEAISFQEEFLHGVEVEELESDSAQAARGKGASGAGAKMGRKKRAPNMLAPGWHIFNQPASGGKMRRYYAGPRISARRVANIMNGDEVPEGAKKSPNETATKTRKSRVGTDKPAQKNATKSDKSTGGASDKKLEQAKISLQRKISKKKMQVEKLEARRDLAKTKEKKKELTQKAREINTELRQMNRDLKKAEKAVDKASGKKTNQKGSFETIRGSNIVRMDYKGNDAEAAAKKATKKALNAAGIKGVSLDWDSSKKVAVMPKVNGQGVSQHGITINYDADKVDMSDSVVDRITSELSKTLNGNKIEVKRQEPFDTYKGRRGLINFTQVKEKK